MTNECADRVMGLFMGGIILAFLVCFTGYNILGFAERSRIISLCESRGGVIAEWGSSLQCQLPGDSQNKIVGRWWKVE